jgi:hypothetical protein
MSHASAPADRIRSSLRQRWAVAAGLAATIALVAGCASAVSGTGRPGNDGATVSAPSFPSAAAPSDSATAPAPGSASPSTSLTSRSTTATATSTPQEMVFCPTIVDVVAHIRYTCLDNGMVETFFPGFTVTMFGRTEPNWVLSQSSLPLTAANESSLEDQAISTVQSFVKNNYPAGSQAVDTVGKHTTVSGRPAVILTALVNIDKSDPDDAGLKAKQDRIVSVAILGTGRSAQLLMAVPDTQKALWPRMDSIAAAAKVV